MKLIKKTALIVIMLSLILGTAACKAEEEADVVETEEETVVEVDENLCIICGGLSKGPLITVKKNGLFGALDKDANQVLPYEYKKISYLGEDRYELQKSDENNNVVTLIVDDKGQEASAPETKQEEDEPKEENKQLEKETATWVNDENRFAFSNGDSFIPEAPTELEELEFVNGRAAITTDWDIAASVGVIDKTGRMIIPPEYTDVRIEKGFIAVDGSMEEDENGSFKELWEIYDYDGNKLSYNKYSQIDVLEKCAIVKNEEGTKYGILAENGQEKLPCEFDNIYSFNKNSKIAAVQKDNKIGFIDENGDMLHEPDFPANGFGVSKGNIQAMFVNSEFGFVPSEDISGTYLLINKNFEVISEVHHLSYVNASDEYIVTSCTDGSSEGYTVTDVDGNTVIKSGEYDEIGKVFDNGLIIARKTPEDGWGLINTEGTALTEFTYGLS